MGESEAIAALATADPRWFDVTLAGSVIQDEHRWLLHAGPPFRRPAAIPAPVVNSLVFACVYEGWAATFEEAAALVMRGGVCLSPAQDVGVVVPLAGVVSPSMCLAAVSAGADADPRYVPLHEGVAQSAMFGRRDSTLLAHRRWIDTELAGWLKGVLHEPLPLLGILRESLSEGDDGHSRTVAGSRGLVEALVGRAGSTLSDRVLSFLDSAPAFALNIWMAAASSILSLVDGIPGSAMVTRAGSNGVDFGIQLSGTPGVWTTVEAPDIVGFRDPRYRDAPQLPAIGDSAVIDFLGLGGQALSTAPDVRSVLAGSLPPDALARPMEILRTPPIDRLGSRAAVTDVRKVLTAGRGPLVLLGILDASGEHGRVGAGVVDVSVQVFESALARLTGEFREVSA
ncbi:DUF1116 domain-containing protein [Nocardia sp. CA2R105]|uniref:oxamate carbamoyltransferase subunit AllG family protein n=1 Tax=Nocardia coffeae TaxID=2873381 RepID=UPI001CA6962B|nr:DUF1116 domain-containing protein [Nocardia coffeae]MBY8863369.1 DUF1116 domain-containing protein [Nocardia coffeae]